MQDGSTLKQVATQNRTAPVLAVNSQCHGRA
jgi:hypothetical protein